MRTQLDAVKAANLTIDAFEIGNEVDWICFNGDVPNGHAPTGFNYLDNTGYHVDGYGTHIYPDANNLEQSVMNTLRQDASTLGPDKPFWITEWGLDAKAYPNEGGQTRGDGIKDFFATLTNMRMPLGPSFYYAYDLLIDAKGALLPEANALASRSSER